MKKYILLFLSLLLTSCFYENDVVKNELSEETKINIWTWEAEKSNTWDLIPKNEKTTTVEENFSKDLNNLFNLVDEESNAN